MQFREHLVGLAGSDMFVQIEWTDNQTKLVGLVTGVGPDGEVFFDEIDTTTRGVVGSYRFPLSQVKTLGFFQGEWDRHWLTHCAEHVETQTPEETLAQMGLTMTDEERLSFIEQNAERAHYIVDASQIGGPLGVPTLVYDFGHYADPIGVPFQTIDELERFVTVAFAKLQQQIFQWKNAGVEIQPRELAPGEMLAEPSAETLAQLGVQAVPVEVEGEAPWPATDEPEGLTPAQV